MQNFRNNDPAPACCAYMNQNRIRKTWWTQNIKHKRNTLMQIHAWYRKKKKEEDRNIHLCGHLDNFEKDTFQFGFQEATQGFSLTKELKWLVFLFACYFFCFTLHRISEMLAQQYFLSELQQASSTCCAQISDNTDWFNKCSTVSNLHIPSCPKIAKIRDTRHLLYFPYDWTVVIKMQFC